MSFLIQNGEILRRQKTQKGNGPGQFSNTDDDNRNQVVPENKRGSLWAQARRLKHVV